MPFHPHAFPLVSLTRSYPVHSQTSSFHLCAPSLIFQIRFVRRRMHHGKRGCTSEHVRVILVAGAIVEILKANLFADYGSGAAEDGSTRELARG